MQGLVVSIGDPTAASIDLSTPVEDLERALLARRDVLLASSAPSQPPTAMLRQGTLLTPFFGYSVQNSAGPVLGLGTAGLALDPPILAYPTELDGRRPHGHDEHMTHGFTRKRAVEFQAIRTGQGALLNRVLCPSCQSFPQ